MQRPASTAVSSSMEVINMTMDGGDSMQFGNQSFHSMYHTNSFSSSVDLPYEPFTPTSGRSTPLTLRSSSFCSPSDGSDFRSTYTPPPRTASKDFSMDAKPGLSPNYLTDGLPATPSAYDGHEGLPGYIVDGMPLSQTPFGGILDVSAPHHPGFRTRITSSPGEADMYSSHNLNNSPFTMPMAMRPVQTMGTHEIPSSWALPMESSLHLLEGRTSPPVPVVKSMRAEIAMKSEPNTSTPIMDRTRRRMYEGARLKSAALQQAQQHTRSPPQGRLLMKRGKSSGDLNDVRDYSVVKEGEHKCKYPGCKKKFARREHLKRHVNTTHLCPRYYRCWYCDQESNRLDNWRDHLKRHTDPNKQTERIKFHEEAVVAYHREMARVRESRKNKTKLPPNIIVIEKKASGQEEWVVD